MDQVTVCDAKFFASRKISGTEECRLVVCANPSASHHTLVPFSILLPVLLKGFILSPSLKSAFQLFQLFFNPFITTLCTIIQM